ncbi:MAG: NADH-quinone oxidoreductase subunit L [Helicobacteraceae bacterium]|jgi:NADH-quinone oxidoreductase subunit L|nr:NADH-quinone oxidoreductase subunit L [Helicobacteraceae bacterium]
MEALLLIALFSPLIGSLFAGLFFGAKEKKIVAGLVPTALLALSLAASSSLLYFIFTEGAKVNVALFDWIVSGRLNLQFGFVADQISVVMMCVVTIVSTVVHIYSIGYMAHDKSFNRFFSYLSAFVFSMMVLVMSDNFLGLFIGWEGVGLCSYLLIGFWYHKPFASWAANEAFIMNRIADLGMLLGIFLIYWLVGSLRYDEVFAALRFVERGYLVWIAILLFIGAMGKSAQFPLHTWLANAMEGPTPVSALIHAATMVTAGVYLLVRANPLYSMVGEIGAFIASLGAFVAFFAASMALVATDLKRIIAYSTLSQLGYMFVAAGLGYYWVALFHLTTHAFFKALLFLGAGNVMHAMHDELHIGKMGKLYAAMKPTAIMMTIASIALAGIYPFAGFFSKDKILEVAFGSAHYVIWATLLITAAMTAFYSFRVVMRVFFGKEANYEKLHIHPHEAPKFMLLAMSPLALLAIVAGLFEPFYKDLVSAALKIDAPHIEHAIEYALIGGTMALVILSIAFAVWKYAKGGFSANWQNAFIYKFLSREWYIPALYKKTIIAPYIAVSDFLWRKIDQKIVDFVVDLIAKIVLASSVRLRKTQSGNLSHMLRLMTAGLVALLAIALIALAAANFGVLQSVKGA